MVMRSSRQLVFLLVIAIVCFAIYSTGLNGAFIYDDIPHIVNNSGIHQVGDFGAALDSGFQETRPVFLASIAVNYWVSGANPLTYHVVNLLLHILCCCLFYYLIRAIENDCKLELPWFPEVSVLIFAVHPLATETVTYINSRSGLLVAALGMGGMLLFLSGRKVAAIVCFLLAMGSKESAVVLPVLTLTYLYLFRPEARLRDTLGLFAAMLVVPLLFFLVDNPHEGTIGSDTLPILEHWMTQSRVVVYLLFLVSYPLQQNIDYDFSVSTEPGLQVIGSAVVLVAVAIGLWRLRRRAPIITYGGFWFFIALAPTNSLVPFKDFIAERHLYLSLAGFAMLVGWGVTTIIAHRRFAVAGLAAYVLSLAALTTMRNSVLANPLTLWRETVEVSPNKARPRVNLGILLFQAGDHDEGAAHLLRAVELDPNDAPAHFNLGVYFERGGMRPAAVHHFRQALALRDQESYKVSFVFNAGELATELQRSGKSLAAATLLREILVASPQEHVLRYNLGVVLESMGKIEDARKEFLETLRVNPDYERARSRLDKMDSRNSSAQ